MGRWLLSWGGLARLGAVLGVVRGGTSYNVYPQALEMLAWILHVVLAQQRDAMVCGCDGHPVHSFHYSNDMSA